MSRACVEFKQRNLLPLAEQQFTVFERNCHRGADERCAHVTRTNSMIVRLAVDPTTNTVTIPDLISDPAIAVATIFVTSCASP
jgi:hypothetical protein